MPAIEPKVDSYIGRSADFAKPILTHLRDLIHQAAPQIGETIKWGFPNFEYKGIVCSMASFKSHCTFTFWKAAVMNDPHQILRTRGETAMGHFGQIKSLGDLPSDEILKEYIKEAVRLNEEGIKVPSKNTTSAPRALEVPDDLLGALSKNTRAKATFENFSPSNKREYVEWITEAKTDATRGKRLETAVEWMAEGKVRNWKYIKK